MDLSSMWLPELEIEDRAFMNGNDKINKLPYVDTVDNLSGNSISSESYTEMKVPNNQNASNYTNKRSSQTTKPLAATTLSSSNTCTISFGDLKSEVEIPSFNEASGSRKIQTMARGPVQAQDHVLAERKRREKLNQHIISMSALLPNLKKMDKASVLEDATNYIRELQDRVKELEGLSGVKRKADAYKESVIAFKRSNSRLSDGDNNETNCESSAHEIEVRMSGSCVLVTIQSDKNSSLVKALSMMENIGLSIISSSAIPFANTTTLVTIVAKLEDDFCMTATDLVKNLQRTL